MATFEEMLRDHTGPVYHDKVYDPAGRVGGYAGPTASSPEPRESAYTELRAALAEWGLESLADWAWDKIVNDLISTEAAFVQIRDTPEWKERFGVAADGLAALGLPAMTEQDIMDYEAGYREVARRYRLPSQFYTPQRIQSLIARGQTFNNAINDIDEGFAKVARTSPETRAAFESWFGPQSEAALAAMFIDGDLGKESLMRAASAAEIAGVGAGRVGAIDQGKAEQLVLGGVSVAEARSGFERIDQQAGLFTESVSEGDDLVGAREGVDAEFGIGGGGGAVRRRQSQRQAAVSGGGGATRGRDGLSGLR